MDNPNTNNPNSHIHTPNVARRPLLWAAAIALILLVLAGITAVNKGWSPNASRSDDRTASASGTTGSKSGTSGSNQRSPSFNDSGSAGSQPAAPSRQPAPIDPTTTRSQ